MFFGGISFDLITKGSCPPSSSLVLFLIFFSSFFQEFHLSQTYHEGFLKLQAKEYEKARELLEFVLKDPLMANAQVLVFA